MPRPVHTASRAVPRSGRRRADRAIAPSAAGPAGVAATIDSTRPALFHVLVLLRRPGYPLGLRQLTELFLERGFAFSPEMVCAWETTPANGRPAPCWLRRRRVGRRGKAPIVHGSGIHQGTWRVGLPPPGCRRRREPGGLHAEHAPGYGRPGTRVRVSLLHPLARDGRARPRGGDDRRPRGPLPRHPGNSGAGGKVSLPPVPPQQNRTGLPGHRGTLPSDARVRQSRAEARPRHGTAEPARLLSGPRQDPRGGAATRARSCSAPV